MEPKLLYIGNGAALAHVPARDLTEADFAERRAVWEQEGITESALLASGLYRKPINEKPAKVRAAKEEGE